MATGCARIYFNPEKKILLSVFLFGCLRNNKWETFSISEDQGEENIYRSINKSQLFAARIVITHSDAIFMLQRPQSHFEVMWHESKCWNEIEDLFSFADYQSKNRF